MQLSRALGHHSAAFTLSVYVHLLPGDEVAPLNVVAECCRDDKGATEAAPLIAA